MNKEAIPPKLEFVRTKFDGLDGKTKVVHATADSNFMLTADRTGVEISGKLLLADHAELQLFAKVLSDAWTDHRKLMPKLQTSLSGH